MLDAHEQKVVDDVNRIGWAVMRVRPNEGDLDPRWFAYTIGLAVTFGWPELICFDLDVDVAADLLNNAVEELKSKGTSPSLGMELTEVIENYRARLGSFPKKFFLDHLGWAIWFVDHRGIKPPQFDCLQLLWPDKGGRFPSDPRCDAGIRKIQTPVTQAEWPFKDPENTAVFSTVGVIKRHEPVCLVCHNEDGSWQFLDGGPVTVADAMVVSLKEVVTTDHSLLELSDLPLGWKAARDNAHSMWQRSDQTVDE
jgi:hypothetical protein